MGQQSVNVGVVDIGTNSMRLLITSGVSEVGRWVEVTGLGQGVDERRRLSEEAMRRTLAVFSRFGELMDQHDVLQRMAIATSASRDAENREDFFDRAEAALGVRPVLISGEEEGRYAFEGAGGADGPSDLLVSDIGGGSTEFVMRSRMWSIEIGSVRLTERALNERPVPSKQVAAARQLVLEMFEEVGVECDLVVGVAGTWTSLAAIAQDLETYQRQRVHGYALARSDLSGLVNHLAGLSLRQIESIPALDPKRAPVILAGAIVAESVLTRVGVDSARVSERDTLDGVASHLLALL